MATSETIRDINGHLLGTIVTEPSGRQVARNKAGLTLGYYYPNSNKTKDKYEQTVSSGNTLLQFLYE